MELVSAQVYRNPLQYNAECVNAVEAELVDRLNAAADGDTVSLQ